MSFIRGEFGCCWDADECTMDPACMLFDNCVETQAEQDEESADAG